MSLQEHTIDIIDVDELEKTWKSKDKLFSMPPLKEGKQPYTLPIKDPALLYYKSNPNGGGITAHIKFRFAKALDGDDDKVTRFLTLRDLSFIVDVGSEKYVVHNEYGYESLVEVSSSPCSDYVCVHVIASPFSYKETKLVKQAETHEQD